MNFIFQSSTIKQIEKKKKTRQVKLNGYANEDTEQTKIWKNWTDIIKKTNNISGTKQ